MYIKKQAKMERDSNKETRYLVKGRNDYKKIDKGETKS